MSPKTEKALLIVLMLVMFTNIVDFMIMMPLSPFLMQEMHVTTATFGLLVSAYSLTAGVSSLLATSLADRFDRRHALLACYAGLVVSTLACATANSFYTLLLGRCIAGFFGGVIGSICLAIVGDVIPNERRGRAMSWVMMGFSLSAVFGVPLGLVIATHSNWRWPFGVLSIVCVLVLAIAARVVPSVRGHLAAQAGQPRAGMLESYRELLSVPNHWWACGATGCLMLSGFTVIPYISPSLVANVGMPASALIYVYLVGGALTLLTRPVIGGLTDRYPRNRVLGALVLMSFVPIILVTQTLPLSLVWQLVIGGAFFVFVSGRFIPAMALVTGATEPRMRGRLMAFNSALQNFAGGVAAMLAGAMMSQDAAGRLLHYGWVGGLSCAFGLLAVWVASRVKMVS
ncbi:Predicted arabinose efflux permease, MFS family [Andreprevotia lacus DSM 23236]|jgi:predicted MFS family arabinose efflux permease|uniref:Predicted arabinose efflux permease, MFS family n=1 Tax=Andreprevotia lacus DSM 23236 TaxID=1121001 RepID=A0A1W1XZG9_9NEIS|nr:MFS transporter [Andreprevotia lacus]SMC29316.1 Predicted arabinose efflux permease, MFS family [Andreprevotia lacus DSM 23236]